MSENKKLKGAKENIPSSQVRKNEAQTQAPCDMKSPTEKN